MSWGGKGCSQMLLFIPWLINTERKWETLTGLSGAPEEDSSQLWCFHLPTQPTWSFSRARRAPLRQRRQGYYPLWWHPPKSFSATGTTSSQAMTRGWEQLFGIWKLLRSPSAETGILMASQSHVQNWEGVESLICRIIQFSVASCCCLVWGGRNTEKANCLLLQNMTLLSIFCMYYITTFFI